MIKIGRLPLLVHRCLYDWNSW